MKLVYHDDCAHAHLSGRCNVKMLDTIDHALSYLEPGYYRDPRFVYNRWDGRNYLFDRERMLFPAGLAPRVIDVLKRCDTTPDVVDERERVFWHDVPSVAPSLTANDGGVLKLYEDQHVAFNRFVDVARGCICAAPNFGKCLGLGTPVLRLDGRVVAVEEVCVGDILAGPGGSPRVVLRVARGCGPLFRVVPNKGQSWVCNDAHVLTVVHSVTNVVSDIVLTDFLKIPRHEREKLKLFQSEVRNFSRVGKRVIDPYFLGVWYGDGRKDLSQGVQISKPDKEIEDTCRDVAERYGLELRIDYYKTCPTYRIVAARGQKNRLLDELRIVVGDGKTLPRDYLLAPYEDRIALLAGLLDTDGYRGLGYFEISQKSEGLTTDIMFLAQSVGFRVSRSVKIVNDAVYHRLILNGDTSRIPLRIERKRGGSLRKRNSLRTGFTIKPAGYGEYAGFVLTGDGRFLLGDFTVTHNTEIAAAIFKLAGSRRCLFIEGGKALASQSRDRLALRLGERVGMLGAQQREDSRRVTVATVSYLWHNLSRLRDFFREQYVLCYDEIHEIGPKMGYAVLARIPSPVRLGLSATIKEAGRRLMIEAYVGPIVSEHSEMEMIEAGRSARPIVSMLRVGGPVLDDALDPDVAYDRGIVDNETRNRAITSAIETAVKHDLATLVLVIRIAHGYALLNAASKLGITCDFVHGKTPLLIIERAKRDLDSGKLPVLIASTIFDRGQDIPNIDAIVIASGQRSPLRTIQRVGRGLRKKRDENVVHVLDFIDHCQRTLRNQSEERRRTHQRKYGTVRIITDTEHWL